MAEKNNHEAENLFWVTLGRKCLPIRPGPLPREHWNHWFERRLPFQPTSGTEKQEKAPEGKVRFEGGEVGYLWNKKRKTCQREVFLDTHGSKCLLSAPAGGPRDRGLPRSNSGASWADLGYPKASKRLLRV